MMTMSGHDDAARYAKYKHNRLIEEAATERLIKTQPGTGVNMVLDTIVATVSALASLVASGLGAMIK
jgi:hypothetical protein